MATANTIRRWIREDFPMANLAYFDGRLPTPRFYISRSIQNQGEWSLCRDFVERITFNPKFCWHREHFRIILIHEMIHSLQWQANSIRTKNEQHGRFFQRHHIRIFGFGYIPGETY